MQRKIAEINTDDAAHCIFDRNLVRHKFNIVCQDCHTPLEVAYHEEMLYSVLCPSCKTITLAKAINPIVAAQRSGGCIRKREG